MKFKIAIVLVFVLLLAGCNTTENLVENAITNEPAQEEATIPIEYNGWDLVWNDEFTDDAIDLDNWSFDVPTNGRWNGEIQSYTDNNAFIENGVLILEAREEEIVEDDGAKYNYSSAKIISKDKQTFLYGRIEVRAKLPSGQGIWPAIWMMPNDEPFYGTWPTCGEIDIMEFLGNKTDQIHGTLHFGTPHKSDQGTYKINENQSFIDEFHTYAIEWEPGEIRWYLDEELYHTVNDWYSYNENNAKDFTYPAPFDQPFFLIMNISVGGEWPGNPDDTTVFPQQMAIDYVRVYQKDTYEIHEKPAGNIVTEREPQEDGNYIYNNDFSMSDFEIEVANEYEGEVVDEWTFFRGPGGISTYHVQDGVLYVEISSGGSEDYSVQVFQTPVKLEEGATYRATFDIKAAEQRKVKLKIGGDDDRGWVDYAEIRPFEVSPDWETKSFDFVMDDSTDLKARFEFNMGKNDADVWIKNVSLIKVSESEIESPVEARSLLPTGNHIYNGTFDQGEERMAFWEFLVADSATATMYIGSDIDERAFVANIESGGEISGDVQLIQEGVPLQEGEVYEVSFSGKADEARSIEINLKAGETIVSQVVELSEDTENYTIELPAIVVADMEGTLIFNIGGHDANVTIDNVNMQKATP